MCTYSYLRIKYSYEYDCYLILIVKIYILPQYIHFFITSIYLNKTVIFIYIILTAQDVLRIILNIPGHPGHFKDIRISTGCPEVILRTLFSGHPQDILGIISERPCGTTLEGRLNILRIKCAV